MLLVVVVMEEEGAVVDGCIGRLQRAVVAPRIPLVPL